MYFSVDECNNPYIGIATLFKDQTTIMSVAEKISIKYYGSLDNPASKSIIDRSKEQDAVVIEVNPKFFSTWDLLSKFKIKSTSTNIYEPYKNAEGSSSSGNTTGISKRRYLFSRDCLITEMEIPGNQKTLTTNPDRLYSPKSTSCQEFNRRTIH